MSYAPHQPQRNKGLRIAAFGCGGVLGLALFASCVALVAGSDDDKEDGGATVTTSSAPVSASPSASSAKPSSPATPVTTEPTPPPQPSPASFGNGDFEVGKDVKPGTYVSKGAEEGLFDLCTATTESADGMINELKSANAGEQVILKVTSSDSVVSIDGCEPFVLRK